MKFFSRVISLSMEKGFKLREQRCMIRRDHMNQNTLVFQDSEVRLYCKCAVGITWALAEQRCQIVFDVSILGRWLLHRQFERDF